MRWSASTSRRRPGSSPPSRAPSFTVASVEERPYRRSPAAPFITSTIQQEAARKLRFAAQRTMRVAQGLYERGYITYMRTDSTTLSETAVRAAREQATALYGAGLGPGVTAGVQEPGEERPGGARGDPARRGAVPPAAPRSAASSPATSCGSTSSSGSARWPPR